MNRGLFEPTVMSFGLTNSPATFVMPLLYLYVTCWSLLAPQPLCVLLDRYLRLPDLVEHGCYGGNLSNYVLVSATSLTFLIYTDLPTYVSLRPLWLLSIVMSTRHSLLVPRLSLLFYVYLTILYAYVFILRALMCLFTLLWLDPYLVVY